MYHVMEAIIYFAGLLHACDYWQIGRTAERMSQAI